MSRNDEMAALYLSGMTMTAVGMLYGLSNQRISQILRATPTRPWKGPCDERPSPNHLSLREAALELGLGRTALLNQARAGQLAFVYSGTTKWVTREDVEAYRRDHLRGKRSVWSAEAGAEAQGLRLQAGLSRDELGRHLGVRGVTVWRWETGRAHPSGGRAAVYSAWRAFRSGAAERTG